MVYNNYILLPPDLPKVNIYIPTSLLFDHLHFRHPWVNLEFNIQDYFDEVLLFVVGDE